MEVEHHRCRLDRVGAAVSSGVLSTPVTLAAPEPDHVAAFRAFSRPVDGADRGLADSKAAGDLPPDLDPRVARCVYDGDEGRIYIVPGPGSVAFVSIRGEAGERTVGHTRTELAAADGLGHVRSSSGGPVTFAGVLPAGARDLRIIDATGRSISVPLSDDDGYWITVARPRDMVWKTRDGGDRQGVFGRYQMYKVLDNSDE
jgi:hypothetical protein